MLIVSNPSQFKAAAAFNRAIVDRLATENGVHAETAVSAASRMAGTLLLRSCGLPIDTMKPGTPVFSDRIDDRGQRVLAAVDEGLSATDVSIDRRRVDYDIKQQHRPQMTLLQIQSLLISSYLAILHQYQLTDEEGAYAGAVSTAMLIEQCAGCLDPHVAYAIAVHGMVEGCKTVPFDAGLSRRPTGNPVLG